MTYVDVHPQRLVHVLVGEQWHDGYLRGWQRHDGRWRGFVTYSVGLGMNHVGWVDESKLRPVGAN